MSKTNTSCSHAVTTFRTIAGLLTPQVFPGYILAACGLVFLSLDDLFTFHEFVGLNLGIGNGKVLLVYLLGAGVFLLANFRRMLPDRTAIILLCSGFLCHAVSLGFDIIQEEGLFRGWTPEEILEVVGGTLYATYIFYIAARELVVVHGLRLIWAGPDAAAESSEGSDRE